MNDVLDPYEKQGDEFRLNAAKMIFGVELVPEEGMRWM